MLRRQQRSPQDYSPKAALEEVYEAISDQLHQQADGGASEKEGAGQEASFQKSTQSVKWSFELFTACVPPKVCRF